MDKYTNRDFYCSSYLIAAGMQLKSFHRTNGITTFEFDNSEKLQDLVTRILFYECFRKRNAIRISNQEP
jgi:hypothetical protein